MALPPDPNSASLRPIESDSYEVPCGRLRLHCRRVIPKGKPWAALAILHGYGEHCGRYIEFMHWLARRGVLCGAFDFRGQGRSLGRRGHVSHWRQYVEDFEEILNSWTKSDDVPWFVLGHSNGGLIAALAGEEGLLAKYGIRGCILSSPYFGTRLPLPAVKRWLARLADPIWPSLRVPTGVQPQWLTSDPHLAREWRRDELIVRTATPRWYFTTLAAQAQAMLKAADFNIPLMCLSGADDIIADPRLTAAFHERAGSADKSLYVYAHHVHELLNEPDRETIFEDVIAWMKARVAMDGRESGNRTERSAIVEVQ